MDWPPDLVGHRLAEKFRERLEPPRGEKKALPERDDPHKPYKQSKESGMRFAALLAVIGCSLAGCALHLHNPTDAKQAKAATDFYGQIDLDAVVTTVRKNSAEISKAESDAIQRLAELVAQRDLAAVITKKPKPDSDLPLGWFMVESEARHALGPLGILDASELKLVAGSDATKNANAIRNRVDKRLDASTDRVRLESMIRSYKSGESPGTLPTHCDYKFPAVEKGKQIPSVADLQNLSKPPAEPDAKWKRYVNFLARACELVRQADRDADLKPLLEKHEDYRKLTQEIGHLERTLTHDEADAKRLKEAFVAARKALAESEEKLAEATVEKQKEKAAADVAKLQSEVADKTAKVESALKAASAVPFASILVKGDIIKEILANFQTLGGKEDTAAHQTTKRLVGLLKAYLDVAGPLKAADKPPVNLLLLELAMQRLEFQRQNARFQADRDRLQLLKAQSDLLIERTAAWLGVVDKAVTLTTVQRLQVEQLATVYDAAGTTEQQGIESVLAAYVYARLKYDAPYALLEFQKAERQRTLGFELSEVALNAWKDFIRAPLQEIAAYYDGGIRSEDLANLIHAIGLGAIAVGANR